jgi:hypothetical protein
MGRFWCPFRARIRRWWDNPGHRSPSSLSPGLNSGSPLGTQPGLRVSVTPDVRSIFFRWFEIHRPVTKVEGRRKGVLPEDHGITS